MRLERKLVYFAKRYLLVKEKGLLPYKVDYIFSILVWLNSLLFVVRVGVGF